MILRVDATSPVPAYDQLREQLTDAIVGGLLRGGDRLAPIRQVARDLQLSPGTVARAYSELEAAALIETRGRKGTFVSEHTDARASGHDEVAAIIDACARRLARYRVDSHQAGLQLTERMTQINTRP